MFRLREFSFSIVAAFVAMLCAPCAIAQNKAGSNQVLSPAYQKWLDEDVRYIITDQERGEFAKLGTDQQREAFVIAFWEERNPNPGSEKNIFKQEHYRRLAYTNTHFAANVPGYKTDRGRIYIMYGPPTSVERHYSAVGSENASSLVGGHPIPYDWELWHYRYIERIGQDVAIKFVDTCGCGQFQIPVEKDDLRKYAPK
jgi:GWxTD domain-containing protein